MLRHVFRVFVVFTTVGNALAAVSLPQPIALWQFENNLLDSAGTNNGTWHGLIDPVYVDSKAGLGKALQLNPAAPTSINNQWVNCGTQLTFATTSAGGTANGVTMAAWVYWFPEGLSLTDSKIVGCSDGLMGGYKMAIYNKKLEMEFRGPPANQVLSVIRNGAGGTVLQANTWYHVAVVYSDEGDYIRTYVNGILDREALNVTQAMGSGFGEVFRIGTETPAYNSGRVHKGYLDDIRIYNSALSQEQIMQVVPEPATVALLGLGGLALLRRKE